MKASILFFPNQQKKNSRNGRIPLYIRVCFKRVKSEARLNYELTEMEASKWDPITMRVQERNSAINHSLNRIEQNFQEFLMVNAIQIPKFTAGYIKDYVLGNNLSEQRLVMQFVDNYFDNAILNNVNLTKGTIKNYRRSINHLKNFLHLRKMEKISFAKLNFEFAQDFKNYLVNTDISANRIGMTEVSASGVIKKFRTIFSEAVDKEFLTKNPFKLVKIKTKSPKKERLTIHQVKQINSLDLGNFPFLSIHRDIFLFCVFTGLAYKDAMNITWNEIECKGDLYKLSIRRVKSDVITESFLPSCAIGIAKKYKLTSNCFSQASSVLPQRSNKELNSQLKLLSTLAKTPIKLTTHIARHTFRQLLAEAGIEDYGVIKRMMGQSRNGDVDEVYYSVTENRLMAAKHKFENYLKNHLV